MTSETPVEALPPISGGAPEQASETESAPADAEAEGAITPPPAAPEAEAGPTRIPFRGRTGPRGAARPRARHRGRRRRKRRPRPAETSRSRPRRRTRPNRPGRRPRPPAGRRGGRRGPAERGAGRAEAEAEAAGRPVPAPADRRARPSPRDRASRRGRSPGRRGPRPAPVAAQAAPGRRRCSRKLAYVIVNEAGASVYSASPVGREEFPDFDATLRGTISIGRRLQDPLAELVKIEPQNIGVGLYQHDVNPKQLKESLEGGHLAVASTSSAST